MAKEWTDAEITEMVEKPDRFFVRDKEEDRYYRHARRDEKRIEELQHEGFRVETDEHGATPDSSLTIESDGTSKRSQVPGMILVSRDRKLHEKIIAKRKSKFEEMAKREEEENLEKVSKILKKVPGFTTKLKRTLRDTGRMENSDREF